MQDAIVRVVVTVLAEQSDLIDERQIRERLHAAYLIAGITRDEVKAAARTRDSGLTEHLGPLQALERYMLANPEYADRQNDLLARAQLLMQELQQELRV